MRSLLLMFSFEWFKGIRLLFRALSFGWCEALSTRLNDDPGVRPNFSQDSVLFEEYVDNFHKRSEGCNRSSPTNRSSEHPSDWYGSPFFSAVLRSHRKTSVSRRIALSFLGSSPTVGRPTRRMDDSCRSYNSGISEKSISRAARPMILLISSSSSQNGQSKGVGYLARFPLFSNLFREVNLDERLIGNIFFVGENLQLIEHLAWQSKRDRFHGCFNAGVKFYFDTVRRGEIEVIGGVMRSPKLPFIPLVFELRHRFNFLFHRLSSRFYSSVAR